MEKDAPDHSAAVEDAVVVFVSEPKILLSWREQEIRRRSLIAKCRRRKDGVKVPNTKFKKGRLDGENATALATDLRLGGSVGTGSR